MFYVTIIYYLTYFSRFVKKVLEKSKNGDQKIEKNKQTLFEKLRKILKE